MEKDLKSTYNQIAEDWSKEHVQDESWWKDAADKFISLLPSGGTVLDVGCGPGIKSRYLISKGLKVVGIDFSEKMVEIAGRKASGGDFRVVDIYKLEDVPEKFDGIFAHAILLHIPKKNVPAILQNTKDKLKNGGYLYVAVKEAKSDHPEEEVLKESDYGYEYERFFSYFSMVEIKKYLAELNMEICFEAITSYNKNNWVQVIARRQTATSEPSV